MDPTLYVEAHAACLFDYRSPQSEDSPLSSLACSRLADNYLQMLTDDTCEQGKAMLERALRHLAGRDTQGRACAAGALFELVSLAVEDYAVADLPTGTDDAVSMKAHSIAAFAYYKKYIATQEQLNAAALDAPRFPLPDGSQHTRSAVESLIRAVEHANQAACMQFISAAVLLVGRAIRDLAGRLDLDIWHFRKYTPLWRALERRDREQFEEKYLCGRREDDNLPAHTICSAPGCMWSVEGYEREPQWPCLGNCVWDRKPWYCSSACRTMDWPNHRASCKLPWTEPPSDLPPTVILDERTRDELLRNLSLKGPFTHYEIVPEDVNSLDARNGTVEVAWDMLSPYVPGKMVRGVVKRYT